MPRAGPGASARGSALFALSELEKGRTRRLDDRLDLDQLPERDRSLCVELTKGTERRRLCLDHVLRQVVHRGLPKDAVVLTALRLGAYQLIYLSGIPPRAAVNETVNLVPASKRGFVNAVLRKVAAREPEWPATGDAVGLATVHGLPEFLVERWVGRFGLEQARKVCEASAHAPEYRLLDPVGGPVRRYSGGEVGPAIVQGLSAFGAAKAVGACPGDTVLDMCAAPGTKTMVLAAAVGPTGKVLAFDVDVERRKLIATNAARLGFTDRVQVAEELPSEVFDRVLVDVPCSNTGVLNRRVEARRWLSNAGIRNRVPIQTELLGEAIRRCRPGGTVVYSTCSLEAEENEMVVGSPPPAVARLERELLSLPEGGGDGGYFAVLTKAD